MTQPTPTIHQQGLILINQNNSTPDIYNKMFSRELMTANGGETALANRTDNIESVIIIVGCGGIGSWAATFFGSLRTTKDIILIDPDIIDVSNLGRTPFNIFQVGDLKVAALSKMLAEKNPTLNIIAIPNYFNEELVEELEHTLDMDRGEYRDVLLIDCRDNYLADYDLFKRLFRSIRLIRAAYDGSSVTIDFRPQHTPVMGRGGYNVVASHILPASLAAQLLVVMAMSSYDEDTSKTDNVFNIPLTFDSLNILEYLFTGVMMERLANNEYENTFELLEMILHDKNIAMHTIQKNLPVEPISETTREVPEEEDVPF